MKPFKSYIVLNGNHFPVYECQAIDEPTTSRNFKLNTPYECNGKLVYMTPNKWLQIDQLMIEDKPYPALELAKEKIGEIKKIKIG